MKIKCSLSSVQAEKLECKGGDKMIDLTSEKDTVLEGCSTETADQIPTKGATEHSDIQIGGNSLFD